MWTYALDAMIAGGVMTDPAFEGGQRASELPENDVC